MPRDERHGARVWLLGLMGAGKTSVGRRLAACLGWRYYDNDEQLQHLSGRSAVELELGAGTDALHRRELEELRGLAVLPPPFVASVAAPPP